MKIHKLISIDVELYEKLKGTNASKLINSLLNEHFKQQKIMTREELIKARDKLKAQYEYETKLEEIENASNTPSN